MGVSHLNRSRSSLRSTLRDCSHLGPMATRKLVAIGADTGRVSSSRKAFRHCAAAAKQRILKRYRAI